jgi:tetratricopeptide (TPR) repeat protein
MRSYSLLFLLVLALLVSTYSYGQPTNTTDMEALVKAYAVNANQLDLQTNPDSVTKAYDLHTKILALDKKYFPSYRAKICIDYKRNNLRKAFRTATAFTTVFPEEGDAWVYFGAVQSKQNDFSGAVASFQKAIALYDKNLKEESEDPSWQTHLNFKKALVQNFLGNREPVYRERKQTGYDQTTTTTLFIDDAGNVDQYMDKFMSYHGIQFF